MCQDGFRMDDIQYKWAARSNKSALDIAPTIELPQLKYKDYKLIERQFQLSTGICQQQHSNVMIFVKQECCFNCYPSHV